MTKPSIIKFVSILAITLSATFTFGQQKNLIGSYSSINVSNDTAIITLKTNGKFTITENFKEGKRMTIGSGAHANDSVILETIEIWGWLSSDPKKKIVVKSGSPKIVLVVNSKNELIRMPSEPKEELGEAYSEIVFQKKH